MGFIDNQAQARAPGAYGIEVIPPRAIAEISLGYIGFTGQFAWGPKQSVYTPADAKDLLDTFEPPGSPRTSTGYRALMGRRGLTIKIVRILGASSAAAVDTVAGTGGNIVSTAKYHGTLGNSITRTIGAASGGDAAKRDFTYVLSDTVTGTTTEIYRDVPLPSGGVDVNIMAYGPSPSKLLASAVIAGAMTVFPANGTASLASGSNGSAIAAADYTGTAGSANQGLALFEVDPDIAVVCHDDCGNTLRAAINLAFAVHANTLRDRTAIVDVNADSADWATVKAARVSGLQLDRVLFNGAWVQTNDDAGVARTSPLSTYQATVLVNLQPHESHAWREDSKAVKYYETVVGIVANFSTFSPTIQGEATEQGICLPIKTQKDKYISLHGRAAIALLNGVPAFLTTRRIKDYMNRAILPSLDPWVEGPNLADDNTDIKTAVDVFLDTLEGRGMLIDHASDIGPTVNTDTTLGNGEFTIAITARTPADREKIFVLYNVGSTVTVTEPPIQ